MRARLQIVERDLDDELGAHVHGHRVASVSRASSAFVCHASISSVIPLNVLPSMTKPPRRFVARAEMEIGQAALAPAVTPLRREHDEIERVQPLDLEPRRRAPAGFVRRRQRFRHHAFVPAGERVVVERLRCGRIAGHETRASGATRGNARRQRVDALRVRRVGQRVARRSACSRRRTPTTAATPASSSRRACGRSGAS